MLDCLVHPAAASSLGDGGGVLPLLVHSIGPKMSRALFQARRSPLSAAKRARLKVSCTFAYCEVTPSTYWSHERTDGAPSRGYRPWCRAISDSLSRRKRAALL